MHTALETTHRAVKGALRRAAARGMPCGLAHRGNDKA